MTFARYNTQEKTKSVETQPRGVGTNRRVQTGHASFSMSEHGQVVSGYGTCAAVKYCQDRPLRRAFTVAHKRHGLGIEIDAVFNAMRVLSGCCL